MGIKHADNELLIVVPGFYVTSCPAWRSQCQVSGHFASETKHPSLSPRFIPLRQENSPEWFPPGFSSRKHAMRRLRRTTICGEKISRAVRWPIGATRTGGHRRLCQRASNALGSASAAKWWPTLKLACVAWKITGSLASKRSFVFPSSGFSRKRFRMQMRSLANVLPRLCPILNLQRNPGANAKS